jgi:hypothetical protein
MVKLFKVLAKIALDIAMRNIDEEREKKYIKHNHPISLSCN